MTDRLPIVMTMLCLMSAGQAIHAGADGTAGPGTGSPATSDHALSTTSDQEYANLVRALGDPHLKVREVATERLCLLDASYLPRLTESFKRQTDFEMKRRLRYVIEYIFHREQLVGSNGFLGVSIDAMTTRVAHDPQTRRDTYGIVVKKAQEGFAARRAGMEDGDVIIGFNGEPLPEDRTSNSFVELVSSHPPGAQLDLTVLRRKEPRRVVVRTGERPTKLLDGLLLELYRAYGERSFLRVLHVDPDSPAADLGLPVRSCILAVNGHSLDDNNAENILRTVVHSARPNSEISVQIAETHEVELDVTLGTRPVELISDAKLQEARKNFVAFWKKQGGELLVLHHQRWQRTNLAHLISSGQLAPEARLLP